MWVYYISALSFLIFLSCIDVWRKKRFLKKFRNVEKLPQLPILGHVHYFLRYGLFGAIKELFDLETCLVWVFSKPIYVTNDPAELKIILCDKNTLRKSTVYEFLDFAKYSVMACDVETWKVNRRLLNKCFNPKQIEAFLSVYDDLSTRMINKFQYEMTTEEVLHSFVYAFTDIFHASLGNLGTNDFNLLTQNFYFNSYDVVMGIAHRFLNPFLYPDFMYNKTEVGKKQKELLTKLNNIILGVIKKKQERIIGTESDSSLKYDFMQILMDEYEPKYRINEFIFFTIAASETLATTLTALVLLLGMHEDIQEKAYQEIVTVIGEKNSVEDIQKSELKYIQMVINETLRLFPPVNYIGRRAEGEVNLGNGKIIPKGTEIFYSIKHLHNDEKSWKNPSQFIPERFSLQETEKRHPYSFIPFSYGPRNCIGFRYAELVMKITVVNLLKKYRIISNCKNLAEIKIPFMPITYMPGDFKLKFEQRHT